MCQGKTVVIHGPSKSDPNAAIQEIIHNLHVACTIYQHPNAPTLSVADFLDQHPPAPFQSEPPHFLLLLLKHHPPLLQMELAQEELDQLHF